MSSTKPAGNNCIVVDGSTWAQEQLLGQPPVFNKHDSYRASLIVIVHELRVGGTEFYIIPPTILEDMVRRRGLEFANKPKKDGSPRSLGFREELPRLAVEQWRGAWHLIDGVMDRP